MLLYALAKNLGPTQFIIGYGLVRSKMLVDLSYIGRDLFYILF